MRETAEVIEHGITVGGKLLRDHLSRDNLIAAKLAKGGPETSQTWIVNRNATMKSGEQKNRP